MSQSRPANVFAIAPGVPFLTTIVHAVRSGELGFAAPDPDDPLALASTTIYVPTRRAARALRALFAETSATGAAVLPVIRPLGDFDEDSGFFSESDPVALSLLPPVGADDRLLTLARLTQAWSAQLGGGALSLMEGEPVMLPRTPADALWLARDLAGLMDEMEREGVSWDRLGGVSAEGLSDWWQLTAKFLGIVTHAFPASLAERQLSDPAAHRNALIRAEAERLQRAPPSGPVIAAGSTGSIPATAEFLSVIARLEAGAVILPGLDRDMDEPSWALIGDAAAAPSTFGHPQYGLKKLLGRFGILRRDVTFLGVSNAALRLRERLVSEALLPAETTDLWNRSAGQLTESDRSAALSGVALIEAPAEREEALAIALALRAGIGERREKSAALVTTDRNLARRVCAELLRFGITADDSGGAPLASSPPAALFQTLLQCVFAPGDPVDLLSVLKHPLALFGQEKPDVTRACEALELVALRGVIGRVTAQKLEAVLNSALSNAADSARKPAWTERIGAQGIEAARSLARSLTLAIAPLTDLLLSQSGLISVPDAVRASVCAFEALGRSARGGVSDLYHGDAGEAFAAHLRGLLPAEPGFVFAPADWPSVHAALIAGKMVKPKAGSDPNVFIWGSLEARLQEVDTLVLGGLNENSWPGRPADDPFLSRGMKASMQIEPPERRIGQAAHDVQMGLGAAQVILSRSARIDGAPSVASRWLQRLAACSGAQEHKAMRHRGGQFLHWAQQLDARSNIDLEPRPAPCPPLALRPKHFWITDIEKLRRDPYFIYAREILKLRPLDPLIRDPDARERGNLFHEIMRRFVGAGAHADAATAAESLREIAVEAFAEEQLPADVQALWWPRFDELVDAIVETERARQDGIKASFLETRADRTAIEATGVTISGRADRIDMRHGAGISIIDYKTSGQPSAAEASKLLNPQLALEGALASRGAFQDIRAQETGELLYYRLLSKGEVKLDPVPSSKSKLAPGELNEKAWGQLAKLVESFNHPAQAYASHALPPKKADGDYDHLARVLEWSAGADVSEDAADG